MRRPIFTGSKSITVKAFAMTQQTEMFLRLVELGDVPMTPNANGLFTVDQVAVLASKRDCLIHKAGDYTIEIKHPVKGQFTNASIMAHDKGLWHPVNIFRACREAARQPHYEIDYAKAKIKNPGNLDEILIASVIGADGVRPYLSGPSNLSEDGVTFGDVGDWTRPMKHVMTGRPGGTQYHYRRAIRALDDAGLLKLTVGARGGFETATFEWLPAAYLTVEAPKLASVDSDYLTDLMAVS
jgi:hypothetical protein